MNSGLGGKRFDKNAFSELGAETETGVADQANEVGLACHELDLLIFAKTHFAQPGTNIRRPRKALDSHSGTGNYATKWTDKRMLITPVSSPITCNQVFHCCETMGIETELQE